MITGRVSRSWRRILGGAGCSSRSGEEGRDSGVVGVVGHSVRRLGDAITQGGKRRSSRSHAWLRVRDVLAGGQAAGFCDHRK